MTTYTVPVGQTVTRIALGVQDTQNVYGMADATTINSAALQVVLRERLKK
jgi:hypothetical protein